MTKTEAIRRLKRAKQLALYNVPNPHCIWNACRMEDLVNYYNHDVVFKEFIEKWGGSFVYLTHVGCTKENVAAVFDASIALLEGK